MPVEVILPKVDMDMATGRISRWHVEDGAVVKKGDPLFEIETDKAAMEIDAPAAGRVRLVGAEVGVDVPVGQAVAWIDEQGEAAGPAAEDGAATAKSVISPLAGEMSALRQALRRTEGVAVPPASPFGVTISDTESRSTLPSSAPPQATSLQSRFSPEPIPSVEIVRSSDLRASPLARRLARASGIDIRSLPGSGPHGRVTRKDIETQSGQDRAPSPPSALPGISPARGEIMRVEIASFLEEVGEDARSVERIISPLAGEMPDRTEGGAVPRKSPDRDEAVLKLFAQGSYELVPHESMRKTIARRLVEAKTTIPHFYLTLDCNIDALLALRTQLNAAAPVRKTDKGEAPAYKLSVNDMVIKALALALRDVPTANVSWTESAMVQHKHADVGVAVSIPGGLITPIVRRADEKTLSMISNEMKDLAARARGKKLKPEEYQGGTSAVSNLGMFGIKDFAAVINPPHATILAVGAGEARAVVEDGAVRIATVMSVTLSTDHRAVDGALGAELLSAFKRHVETPLGMLV